MLPNRGVLLYYDFNPGLPPPLHVIHPIQLKAVQKLLAMDIPDEVEYIFLFGGSLEPACNPWSDLDLYIVYKDGADRNRILKDMRRLCAQLGKKYDLLAVGRETFLDCVYDLNTVENDILMKGICIYAKNKKSNPVGPREG